MVGFLKIFELPQASTVAKDIDTLYNFIFWFSIVIFVVVVGTTCYFVWRYRRSRNDPEKTAYITGHTLLESTTAAILFVAVMVMFYWGWVKYEKLITAPSNSLEINVIGKQWLWEFEYTNGRKMINEIVVPKGKPVKLLMTSADVLHSFYVPNFRIKQDVVPKAYTTVWFNATQTGDHKVFCAEYCGTAHSKMMAVVKVVEAQDYERWQVTWEFEQKLSMSEAQAALPVTDAASEVSVASMAERGKKIFGGKGCVACHSVTGQAVIGPAVNGIFGKEEELTDGTKVTVDENYLRESLMDPHVKLVKGYQALMPTYRGTLTDDEVNALVAYIKGLEK